MISYHGCPITPNEAAIACLTGRAAMVSYAVPWQANLALEVAQQVAIDNGAFSAWRRGAAFDVEGYYAFVDGCRLHPRFSWAVIPDVIDGSEEQNDELIDAWPFHQADGVPVWHLHESLDRLEALVKHWPRVALGSSGDYGTPGTPLWWHRIDAAMAVCCDKPGRPLTKLHGLRMLSADIVSRLPFHSADSTNIARNIGIDRWWRGMNGSISKKTRALVMAERIDAVQSPAVYDRRPLVKTIRRVTDDRQQALLV